MTRWLRYAPPALALALGIAFAACSQGSTPADDIPAGYVDAGVGPMDADVSSVATPVDCRTPDSGTCDDCCRVAFADGGPAASSMLASSCACPADVDGGCGAPCDGVCEDAGSPSDPASCQTCLRSKITSGAKCYQTAVVACEKDTDCLSFLACTSSCPPAGM